MGAGLCGRAPAVHAQAPHEVALIYNGASERSVNMARIYAEGRGIPVINRIGVEIPARLLEPVPRMTADEFSGLIWQPVRAELAQRGLGEQVMAWIYSVDFPLRVEGDPPLSLTGLTFLRNNWPDPDEARDGRYVSPLYGGPDPDDGRTRPPSDFFHQRKVIGQETMPLPAAMLGYAGPGGNDIGVVLRTLRNGLAADATRPDGAVYFVVSDDIRSRVRHWQFETACLELERLGVRGIVTSEFPEGKEVLGLLAGSADPDPGRIGRYLPGSFAEHLTSFSGVYDFKQQTKMTDWTAAGAGASAGVVTEPRAYWTKFPTARFFVYYAAGCNLLESFYQAVRCPLQSVLIGDPLMRPFGRPHTLVFDTTIPDGRDRLRGRVRGAHPLEYPFWEVWIDNRFVTRGTGVMNFDIEALDLPPGDHRLRAVARRAGPLSHPVWAETSIMIEAKGKD